MALLTKLKPLETTKMVLSAIAEQQPLALALGFVIGSVREDRKTLDETMVRARELRDLVLRASGGRTAAVVLPLCSVPLPGTPDFRSFDKAIRFGADDCPEAYNISMSVLETEQFTPLETTRFRQMIRDELNGASMASHG